MGKPSRRRTRRERHGRRCGYYTCQCPRHVARSGDLRRCRRCGARWLLVRRVVHPWGDDATFEDTTITPALAGEWLSEARSVMGPNDPEVVARHAAMMRAGTWTDVVLANGGIWHPIAWAPDGTVRNGLQRLAACVEAGVAFRATVGRFRSNPSWLVAFATGSRPLTGAERRLLRLAVEAKAGTCAPAGIGDGGSLPAIAAIAEGASPWDLLTEFGAQGNDVAPELV